MLSYVTSNTNKIEVARKYLTPLGLEFDAESVDLVELQSNSIEEIAMHKAAQAFDKLQKPLFVMDSGWSIPALNGFPGPYMKYLNKWLHADEYLNLMKPYANRSIICQEVICYKDKSITKLISGELHGRILLEKEGEGVPSWTTVTLRNDGKSIAKCWEKGIEPADKYPLWTDFAEWIKAN